MARGRMLNKTICTDSRVAELGILTGDPWAIVFYMRCIPFLDRNGIIRGDSYWLKAEVMPREDHIEPVDLGEWAVALVRLGLAVAFDCDGMPYLHFPGFRRNQPHLRWEREGEGCPVPDGFDFESGTMPDDFQPAGGFPAEPDPDWVRQPSVNLPAVLRQPSGSTPDLIRSNSGLNQEVLPVEVEVKVEVKDTSVSVPKSNGTPSELADVFRYWVTARKRVLKNAREPSLTPKREKGIRARLADGFTAPELIRAVDGMLGSAFHVKEGFTDILQVVRSPEKVDYFLELADKNGTGPEDYSALKGMMKSLEGGAE